MPRSLNLALFVTGLIWLVAAHALALNASLGLADHLGWSVPIQDLLGTIFLLFLLLTGFTTLNWIATRQGSVRLTNALPSRPTAPNEFARGALLGWAAAVAALLPLVLFGALHPFFSFSAQAIATTLVSIASLLLAALAAEVAFRGFIFRRLIDAIGPVAATLSLAALYALVSGFRPNAGLLSVVVTFIAGLLYALAYLRTHALWLGWGLHAAWIAAAALLFGQPVGGVASYSGIIQSNVSGPIWLTGGAFGLEGALFTATVLLVAMAVLYPVTRDYAWSYTHPVIVPAGYPMEARPPAAHIAMEQAAAAAPAPLVQIAPAPPSAPAGPPASEPASHF
jgi:membrane protease YdiL (CAAX protease family)